MGTRDALSTFIRSNLAAALALRGDWGVGKTYLWKQTVRDTKRPLRPEEEATYVSLFGINSLDELKRVVAYSSSESEAAWKIRDHLADADYEKKKGAQKRKPKFFSIPPWFSKHAPWLLRAAKPPFVDSAAIANAINELSFYGVRRRLICLDDIERRGKGLNLTDVLGLVSYLVEERDCRVCVILNDKQLASEDSAIWEAQREKVFSQEVLYAPTSSESVELGLNGLEQKNWFVPAKAALTELQITNVRLIRRIASRLSTSLDVHPDVADETLRRATRAIVFAEYCHSGTGVGAPNLKFALAKTPMSLAIDTMRKERGEPGLSEGEVEWAELIQRYDFDPSDPLTAELTRAVNTGVPNRAAIAVLLENSDEREAIRQAKNEYLKVWSLFNDHIEDNVAEVVNGFEQKWPAVSPHEHVINLLATANFLRRSGRPDLASQFIDQWIEERCGERAKELCPHNIHEFETITDKELLSKAATAYAGAAVRVPLEDALQQLARGQIHDDEIEAVAATLPADLYAHMKRNPGPHLRHAISRCLSLHQHGRPDWAAASDVMRSALLLAASESPANAERICNRYGISATS